MYFVRDLMPLAPKTESQDGESTSADPHKIELINESTPGLENIDGSQYYYMAFASLRQSLQVS